MYGDPQHLRVLAHLLEEEAHRVAASATRLGRSASAVRWESTAAGLMQSRVQGQVRSMRQVARHYAEAAAAVRAHAAAVEQQLDRIEQVQARVHRLGSALEHLAAAGAPVTAVLARHLPPPGHRDWLDVPARFAALGVAL